MQQFTCSVYVQIQIHIQTQIQIYVVGHQQWGLLQLLVTSPIASVSNPTNHVCMILASMSNNGKLLESILFAYADGMKIKILYTRTKHCSHTACSLFSVYQCIRIYMICVLDAYPVYIRNVMFNYNTYFLRQSVVRLKRSVRTRPLRFIDIPLKPKASFTHKRMLGEILNMIIIMF